MGILAIPISHVNLLSSTCYQAAASLILRISSRIRCSARSGTTSHATRSRIVPASFSTTLVTTFSIICSISSSLIAEAFSSTSTMAVSTATCSGSSSAGGTSATGAGPNAGSAKAGAISAAGSSNTGSSNTGSSNTGSSNTGSSNTGSSNTGAS
ncbi:MAG: pentapeptide repeat-containing protein [Deltaproteobacteria bacterium]|nr:pentapeptide repeat-containing protein [Deltaproteobacteria bacterium]